MKNIQKQRDEMCDETDVSPQTSKITKLFVKARKLIRKLELRLNCVK